MTNKPVRQQRRHIGLLALRGACLGFACFGMVVATLPASAWAQQAQGQGQGQWFVPGQGQGQGQGQPRPAQPAQAPRPVAPPPPTPSLLPQAEAPPAPGSVPQAMLQQLPPITPSAPPPAPIIGVLDLDSLRTRWAPFNTLDTAIRNRVNRLRADEARERQALDEASRAFVAQRAQMTPQQQRQRQTEIERRAAELTREFGERQRETQALAQQGEFLQSILRAVVSQVARARGINLILLSNVVALNDAPLDITPDVLAQLQQVPVVVNVPPDPAQGQPAAEAPPAAPAAPAAPPAAPRRN
jgi:Skp family chaperone for outer membrane proteins